MSDGRQERMQLVSRLFTHGFPEIWCPLLTHYADDGRIDGERMDRHVDFVARHVPAFLVPGTTGDGWELSFAQFRALMEYLLVLGARRPELAVLVGILHPDVAGMRRRIDWVAERTRGAGWFKGFVVCPPSGATHDAQQTARALEQLLGLGHPTVLYQLPQITRNEITPELVAHLAGNYPNCYMLKDSSGADRVAAAGLDYGGLLLVRGAEGDYSRMLKAAGGLYDGFLLSTANCFAQELTAILGRLKRGDRSGADLASTRLTAAVRGLFDLAAPLPQGNAFANANRLADHVNAYGAHWRAWPPPRLRGGERLPATAVEAAATLLAAHQFAPPDGYLAPENRDTLKRRLAVSDQALHTVNALLQGDGPVIDGLLEVIERHGGVAAINRKAHAASRLDHQMERLRQMGSPYLRDLEWLREQVERRAFVAMEEYRREVLRERYAALPCDAARAVTLEISALQFFPWLITQARQAIDRRELMPARYIRVRNMREQAADQGDLIAVAAAMHIIGANWVETLDTRGTDGANVHLGGPETIAGYFGGAGQPNDYALRWVDEYLHYYTNYGVRQVLNLNPGTVLLGYLLHKLGIDNEFKVSVFMGNDNPYSVLATLLLARLFSRDDGTTALVGFNFSNSADNRTLELAAATRRELAFEELVRFEHHITETWKGIVRQPYDRLDELPAVAARVRNISAKHEGGPPAVEVEREHPSDLFDYFRSKEAILEEGLMGAMEQNYLDKHAAVNRTARRLFEHGIAVVAAANLH